MILKDLILFIYKCHVITLLFVWTFSNLYWKAKPYNYYEKNYSFYWRHFIFYAM